MYILLIEDFVFNLYSCYKIVKLHRKINQGIFPAPVLKAKKEEIQMLVLTETLEFFVPLTYITAFLLSYYGRNSKLLGGIRNSYWQYEEVHNVPKLLLSVLQMFVIDIGSIVIGGLVLWKFCLVNVAYEYCTIIKTYWKIISIRVATETTKVSRTNFHDEVCLLQRDNF